MIKLYNDAAHNQPTPAAAGSDGLKDAAFAHLLDPLILIDDQGNVVEFNPAAERTFGYRRDEAAGASLASLIIPPELREPHRKAMDRLRETGVGQMLDRRVELEAQRKDGSRFPIELTISRIDADGGTCFLGQIRDLTADRAETDRLMTTTNRLSTLISSLPNPVMIEDENRRVVLINQAMCDTFELPVDASEMIGFDCASNHPPVSRQLMKHPEHFVERVDELLERREPCQREIVEFADGRMFERDFTPIILEDEFRGVMWLYRDVTRQRRAALDLQRDRDHAIEVSRSKSDFLAMTSHEIRTPMHGVLGTVDLLLDSELDNEQRELALVVKDSSEALLAIINDILDFSKIESGRIELEHEQLRICDIVDNVCELVGASLYDKGVALGCKVSGEVDRNLVGDGNRIRQVLTNLVGNAAKFTENGEVVVTVESLHKNDTHQALRFTVTDTGTGISNAPGLDIFEPFVQARDGFAGRGTGLGLAIAKRIVELMNGTIEFDTRPGVGSEFRFSIQLERGEQVAQWPKIEGQRALVLGGPPRTGAALVGQLAAFGIEGRYEFDAERGKAWAFEHGPTLVFSDGRADAASEIAREFDAEVFEIGATRSAMRPLTAHKLAKLLKLEIDFDTDRTETPVAEMELSGTVLVAEDNAVNRELVLMQLASIGVAARAVNNGAEAVEAFNCAPPGRYSCILMDCQMPVLDGFEATKRLREVEAGRKQGAGSRGETSIPIPVIALTASGTADDRRRALDVGMNDLLTKPITRDRLARSLARWIGSAKPAEHAEEHESVGTIRGALDRAHLDSLVEEMGDRDTIDRIVQIFLRELPVREQSIETAHETGDTAALASAAHTLKSTCAALGANEASDICARIESSALNGNVDAVDPLVESLHKRLNDAQDELSEWLEAA